MSPAAAQADREPVLRVEPVEAAAEDRFDRLRRIEWWDQDRLARAKVLVVGAGALGNEVLKQLALLGVGRVLVVDLDTVELSNLSRAVLFRERDEGRPKAEVAAEAVRAIYPQARVRAARADVIHDVGLGVFHWADVVIGGLDNREARLAINRACYRVGRPWVDGAIERLQGVARGFAPPEGACYECTLGEVDWQMIERRRACSLLTREEMEQGKVPTTPTTASVVAGIQVQEAVKLLHGLPDVLAGRGFVFDGMAHQSYIVEYARNPDCLSHETLPSEALVRLPFRAADVTLARLLEEGRRRLDAPGAVLELRNDVLWKLECRACGAVEEAFRSLGRVLRGEARCPSCSEMRAPVLARTLRGGEPFLERTPAAIGVPPFDALTARAGEREVALLLGGDEAEVLGEVA